MVEEIFGKDKFNKVVEKMRDHLAIVKLTLTTEEIQKWKENGNFKHIRNELSILPKLKYSCTIDDNNCHYYFICDNVWLRNRISHMLESLIENNKKRIANVTNYPTVNRQHYISDLKITGEPKYCNLFS